MSIKEFCLGDTDSSLPIFVDVIKDVTESSEQEDLKDGSVEIERWEGEGGSIAS